MTSEELQEFFSIRKEAGLKIDPATAEVDWEYAQVADPYGIRPDLPEESASRAGLFRAFSRK